MDPRAARPAAALAVVLGADAALALRPPWLLGGLLDEPAHGATAALVLSSLPGRPRAWRAGFALASVAVDVDHLPLVPRRAEITTRTPRPAGHTLALPAALAALARALPPRAAEPVRGAAAGALAHLARDLATGPGVALLAPLTARRTRLPYRLYALGLAALALAAIARARPAAPIRARI